MKINLNLILFVLFLEDFEVSARSNCPTLRIAHGRVKIRSRGRIARFRCRRKFMLYGSKMAVCIGDTWSHHPPVCIAARCPDLDLEDNVQMVPDPKYKGALLKFSCQDGLTLNGADTLYCDGNKWNDDPPSCLLREAERECNFEDINLCGWTQDSDDIFDWVWHTGPTATAQTGPTRDHTFPNDTTGHYLYIEASSPRQKGDIARIRSPFYPAIEDGFCFGLWYHMQGPDIRDQVGTLEIFILEEGEDLADKDPVFYIEGNQGSAWLKATVDIGAVNSSFQVVIQATRKNSYVGDISIDDARIYSCSEDTQEVTTLSVTTAEMGETTEEPSFTTNIVEIVTTNRAITTQIQELQSSSATETTSVPEGTTQVEETTTVLLPEPTSSETMISVSSHSTTEITLPVTTVTVPATTERETEVQTEIDDKQTTTEIVTSKVLTTEFVESEQTTNLKLTSYVHKTEPTLSTRKKLTAKTTSRTEEKTTSISADSTQRLTTVAQHTEKPETETVTKVLMSIQTSEMSSIEKENQTMQQIISNTTETVNIWENSTNVITDTNLTNNITNDNHSSTIVSTTTDLPNIIKVDWRKSNDQTITQPLLIGVGVGVAVGLLIILIVIFVWIKKRRRKEEELFEDEMAPIAKNACNEW